MRVHQRRRTVIGTVVGAALLAIGLAACGSSSSSSGGATTTAAGAGAAATTTTAAPSGYNYGNATTTPTTAAAAGAAATVDVGTTKFGKILVDANGMTLYAYDSDSAGKSSCNGGCASAWPPLEVTGTPTYGSGLSAAMFSVITRDDGSKQVAVNGQPLYTWGGDQKAGDVTGQNVNGFHVVGTDGKKITTAA
jgi:predicted lipoprotein with Yx(FWY)xxD motif